MILIETDRLILRKVEEIDAAFILQLLNEPGWLEYIGDKGVRSMEDAFHYIKTGPHAMYEREGFGLFLVEWKGNQAPIGLCGLIKRDGLDDVDIGYALLADYHNKGFAFEAAQGTLEYAKDIGLKRITAITTKDNHSSVKLLEKLGMKPNGFVILPNDNEELMKFSLDL
ncbi:GNAT family N-acetyltransferase [Sutcliffiella sp. NPDC057660]|uniref:GNAT family N-acetyltransferase n=1 Tax=Sutcliffiella sp. NPDC057660 TaxID=3346199 RepID=UPI003698990B